MTGFIYAIRCLDRVKIGWSEDPIRRFKSISGNTPAPCVLLGYEAGDRESEAALHELFREYHTHGEWFQLRGRVAEYVVMMEHAAPRLKAAIHKSALPKSTSQKSDEISLEDVKAARKERAASYPIAMADKDVARLIGVGAHVPRDWRIRGSISQKYWAALHGAGVASFESLAAYTSQTESAA